jgi:hypothetical protein
MIRFSTIAIITFLCTAQIANAQNIIELEPFDAILATGNFEIILEPGDSERVIVELHNAPKDEVHIKVVRGELRINFLNSLLYKNYEARIVVHYRKLRQIKGIAGARISSPASVQGDQLELRAGSGATLTLQLDVDALEATALEGGVLQLKGTANSQRVSATSGGTFEGFGLECARTYVRASLGGQARIVARKMLEASAHTGGSIEYKGDPQESNVKNLLSGDIRKAR